MLEMGERLIKDKVEYWSITKDTACMEAIRKG